MNFPADPKRLENQIDWVGSLFQARNGPELSAARAGPLLAPGTELLGTPESLVVAVHVAVEREKLEYQMVLSASVQAM